MARRSAPGSSPSCGRRRDTPSAGPRAVPDPRTSLTWPRGMRAHSSSTFCRNGVIHDRSSSTSNDVRLPRRYAVKLRGERLHAARVLDQDVSALQLAIQRVDRVGQFASSRH